MEEFSTTFGMDFQIADYFGIDAINNTFERAFNEWKTDYRYLTDLAMVVNHRSWYWYGKNDEYSSLYADLYYKVRDYAYTNLKGSELKYYFDITD